MITVINIITVLLKRAGSVQQTDTHTKIISPSFISKTVKVTYLKFSARTLLKP